MKVRHQLIFLLSIVMVSIFILSFFLQKSISSRTNSLLHEKISETKEKEVPKLFRLNAAYIENYVYDYSVWDQMVDFLAGRQAAEWANDELGQLLVNYNIDYVWVLDSNAKSYYHITSEKTGVAKPLSISEAVLKKSFSAPKSGPFYIKHNGQLIEVFAGGITHTVDRERKERPQGYLVLARVVDDEYIAGLHDISSEIKFTFFDGAAGPDYTNSSSGEMRVGIPLQGFDGGTIASFVADRSYPVLKGYQQYLNWYLLAFLGFMCLIGFVFYFISKRMLLSPLSRISSSLQEHNSFQLTSYNAKKNEFGDLSRLITQFFSQKRRLEIEVESRKKSESVLRKTLDEKYTEQSERIKAQEFLLSQQAALNLKKDSTDFDIDDLLRDIAVHAANAIQCERVGIWFYNDDLSCISPKFIYNKSKNNFGKGEVATCDDYPEYFEYLRRDTLIVADDARNHPATSELTDSYLIPEGITSMLDVPILSGNKIIGVVCYEHTGPIRKWTISEQTFTRALADIIALNIERDERKKVEEKLKKGKTRFEETQELAQIGSWEYDFITQEVIWSKEMYRIFELTDAPPEKLFDLYRSKIHAADIKLFDDSIKNLLEKGDTYSVECRLLTTIGEVKHVIAIGETIKSNRQGKIIGLRGTVQDITKQKSAANAKSEFLSVMSHEIRTPINGVIGIANLLMEEEMTPKQKEYVATLNFSAQHLSTVVSDILDFSKIEAGHMVFENVSFNLEKNCRYMYDLFVQKATEKGIKLNFRFFPSDTENYSMYGDYVRLNQVLSNLLSNAIKFTENGNVDFEYTITGGNEDKVNVCFRVKDSGIGMSEIQQQKIFESFTQADETITRQYGGTGLGLTICKKLVELQGGKIYVNSKPGEGSEFIVDMAFDKHVYKGAEEAKITTAEKNQLKDLKGMRILVAEDNKINAMVLTRFLSKWNVETKVAKDGAEAIDFLHRESFHIVLMDIQMPNVDGIEATRLIRNSAIDKVKGIPVVAFTADASVDTHRELLKIGFDHCMTKPFNPETLFSFLKKNYNAA